jgi:hypothetical protein
MSKCVFLCALAYVNTSLQKVTENLKSNTMYLYKNMTYSKDAIFTNFLKCPCRIKKIG